MSDKQVYVVMPTAQKDHVPEVLTKWAARGYNIGLWVDPGKLREDLTSTFITIGGYPGVWKAWNALTQCAFSVGADVVVMIGDDMEPDPNKSAQEIAKEYFERFPDGEGVMQPCGDPQGKDESGLSAAARICGSPWVGRQWARMAYGGRGPVNENYYAFYADEEMKLVAERANLLWMRHDLSQFHYHWSWGHVPKQEYHSRNNKRWEADKALFMARKDEKFPGVLWR